MRFNVENTKGCEVVRCLICENEEYSTRMYHDPKYTKLLGDLTLRRWDCTWSMISFEHPIRFFRFGYDLTLIFYL